MITALSCLGNALATRLEALLTRLWWQPHPTLLARLLQPCAALYGWLAALDRARAEARARSLAPRPTPVPLLVVGNFIVGGAGKTPAVIAVVQAMRAAGRHPGVISRGHGRNGGGVRAVALSDTAAAVGDEPLLIRRRTGVPVWVGRDRMAAARGLCAQHQDVDVLVADDGLQHHALARAAALVVFDERGAGNGLVLPAGPLREQMPQTLPAHMRVLYTSGRASTPLPGAIAQRVIASAWPLASWCAGDEHSAVPLAALQGRPLWAVAGLAAPENFFSMLEAQGLSITRLPLADHHAYRTLPWPATAADVLVTEKDAVKLDPQRPGKTRIWVVPLDLQLPVGLIEELLAWLPMNAPIPAPTPAAP